MKKGSKGQGMVEFGLILPLILLVILGMVVFAHLFAVFETVQNAASEGGRVASVWRPDEVTTCASVVQAAVERTTPFFNPATDVVTTSANCSSDPWARIPSGTLIDVAVTVRWEPIFFGTLGQDYWEPPRTLPLNAEITVRHE